MCPSNYNTAVRPAIPILVGAGRRGTNLGKQNDITPRRLAPSTAVSPG